MSEPKCKYFGDCGGCRLQHVPYEAQLESKRKRLEAVTKLPEIKVISKDPYSYRNRMDFIFHQGGLGLRKAGKWYSIVDIERCEIANDPVNLLLAEVKAYFKDIDAFDLKKHTGTFRYCIIRATSRSSSISFLLNEKSMKLMDTVEKIREYAQKSSADNIIVAYLDPRREESFSAEYFVIKGTEFLSEEFLGKTFYFPIQGFFQNNSNMAQEMLKYVNELLKKYETKGSTLLDLYGGVGTFGIVNADMFKDVLIIESLKEAIDCAKKNTDANKANNSKAICLDAEKLKKVEIKGPLFVITDPPRSGMHMKTIQRLNDLKPKVIIYISCNVEQLERDLPKFRDYEIKSAALFDLFPQTQHSEAIVELVLRNSNNPS